MKGGKFPISDKEMISGLRREYNKMMRAPVFDDWVVEGATRSEEGDAFIYALLTPVLDELLKYIPQALTPKVKRTALRDHKDMYSPM